MLTKLCDFLTRRWASILYRCSLFLLVFFTFGFIIVTPADLISQARRNSQIYNVIIVAATYFAVTSFAILLYAVRVYDVRSALSDIPKRYVPGQHDLPKSCSDVIQAELVRCRMIQASLLPQEGISHPGLPPPHSDFDFSQVPYLEVLIESVKVLETKACNLHPELQRRPGMPLRDYFMFLGQYVPIDVGLSRKFLDYYEEVRFSNCQITEERFKYIMRIFALLMRSVYLPDRMERSLPLERVDTAQS
ncbi:hypothetical protein V1512DRAFT_259228 [Lipomyces arxii]|uniref:uncharacterized protein n=1 Tax=Lipomyces arxii TaxID=56418 RepID=UPI0034CE0ABF